MSLREYHRKRDFRRTAEPQGAVSADQQVRRFVVQKHSASRLHFDFRLELDGVLKSWAVPKGPSLDPTVKALAVQVEDHPVDYASFEGVIPQGEYGSGTVIVWDHGDWEPLNDPDQGLRDGKLKFRLQGSKLHGEWHLVRMSGKAGGGGKNWLLMKHRDKHARQNGHLASADDRSALSGRTMDEIAEAPEPVNAASRKQKADASHKSANPKDGLNAGALSGARKAAQPISLQPQLATLSKTPPAGEGWLHEVKFDGYRLIGVKVRGQVKLWTRGGNDWSDRFPSIAAAIKMLPVKQAIFDGEVVVQDADGLSDFQALQNLLRKRRHGNLGYYIFDLPFADGYDLTRTPLVERKELLQAILENRTVASAKHPLAYSDHIVGHGAETLKNACRMRMEGIVSKQTQSPYESRRTHTWLKSKCSQRQEFVIGGYTRPSGARTGFGALLLGYYGKEKNLVYCGRVGTGFTDESLQEIAKSLKARAIEESPFDRGPNRAESRGAQWVRPELVCEVEFSEWTSDNRLRHPAFHGIREDKEPHNVMREQPQPLPGGKRAARSSRSTRKSAPSAAFDRSTNAEVAGVTITHPSRIVFPDRQLTKLDVARYYESVAEWILPELIDRPLTLVRCPKGIGEKCFYQKHVHETLPPPVRGVPVKEPAGTGRYVAIDDLPGLITLVQFGTIELHPWGSRLDRLEQPDRMVFDLDPGPGVDWQAIIAAARRVRDLLADFGLQSFLRTTGGHGLHVVVPLERRASWDEVKSFSKSVANALMAAWPSDFLITARKANRKGKIFVDYLRNSRGATAIASYSLRARPAAAVATPLRWDELTPRLDPQQFEPNRVVRRLSAIKRDPWPEFHSVRQSITAKLLKQVESLAKASG